MAHLSSKTVEASLSLNEFWKSISILVNKFHVVNKRLWGSKTILTNAYKPVFTEWSLPTDCRKLKNNENVEEYMKDFCEKLQIQKCSDSEREAMIEVTVVEFLPKTYEDNHAFQLVIMIKDKGVAKFIDVTPKDKDQKLCPEFPYLLQLENDRILLKAECDITSKSHDWLKDCVLPQFVKWANECSSSVVQHDINESLALVSNDKYYKKYNELKLKYGKEMVKIWPECTDPSKFVYEDVAIATYLLVLWEDAGSAKQTFVDLGCGNGLLVYILTKEGHRGVGLDIRRRQIWDMYTDDVILEEKTITPSDTHLFPDTDWIIGNHSDELTPWIPVITARSSYKCNFFLLPCCAFNFDGTKFKRQDSSKSQYTEYLKYIKQVCKDCGFNTYMDRLKIPSTKRICLISKGRVYPKEEHDKYCNSIQEIINNGISVVIENNEMWIKDFKPRDPVERVRNCTQIDKTLIDSIVQCISQYLLDGCDLGSDWSVGKTVDLGEVVQLISQDKLKALKSECGGLQTLLKNNHHIFKVQSGTVQLRYPKTVHEVNNGFKTNKRKGVKNLKIQQRPCWFYNNHPQGCPLSNANCSFLHVQS